MAASSHIGEAALIVAASLRKSKTKGPLLRAFFRGDAFTFASSFMVAWSS